MGKICSENPYILLLRASVPLLEKHMKPIIQYVQNILRLWFVLFISCCCLWCVVSRKKQRSPSFYSNYGKKYLAQHEHISPSQNMCTNATSTGPTKGRDDRGHLSVVSLEALLLMTGASLARSHQYNSYVSYL